MPNEYLTPEQKKRLKRLKRRKAAGKSINEQRLKKLKVIKSGKGWAGGPTKGLGKAEDDETEEKAWVPKGVKEERRAGVDDIVSTWDWLSNQPGFSDLPLELQKAVWQKLKHNDDTWPFSEFGPEGEQQSDRLMLLMLAKAGAELGMSAEELGQYITEDWAVQENSWGGTGPTMGTDMWAYFNPESTLYDPKKGQMMYGISEADYNLLWDTLQAYQEANPEFFGPEAWRGPEGAMRDYVREELKRKREAGLGVGQGTDTSRGGGDSSGGRRPSPSNMEIEGVNYLSFTPPVGGPAAPAEGPPRRQLPGEDARFPQGSGMTSSYITNRTNNNALPAPVSPLGGGGGLGPLSWRSRGRRHRWL